MAVYALRLENGADTAVRMRQLDAMGLSAAGVLATRTGLRPDGGGAVTVVDGSMDVAVPAFGAWIQGTASGSQGGYPFVSNTPVQLTLDPGDATQARVDTIVGRVQDNAYDTSGQVLATVEVVKGTPGAGAPALPATCVPLWDVNVPAGVSAGTGGLNGSNLGADRRVYMTGLGGVLPVASETERDQLVGVVPGQVVYRADTQVLEVRTATGWGPVSPPRVRVARGSFTLSDGGSAPSSRTINLPAGLFSTPPTVQLTQGTGAGQGTVSTVWVSGTPSVNSFTASIARTTTTTVTVYWTAFED